MKKLSITMRLEMAFADAINDHSKPTPVDHFSPLERMALENRGFSSRKGEVRVEKLSTLHLFPVDGWQLSIQELYINYHRWMDSKNPSKDVELGYFAIRQYVRCLHRNIKAYEENEKPPQETQGPPGD